MPKAYCGHCGKQRAYTNDSRCKKCKKPIWELHAAHNETPLRTTDKTYAALVRYGAK